MLFISISEHFLKSAKITCDMSWHTVVYLDQNYLSNMAKAQLGSLTDQVLRIDLEYFHVFVHRNNGVFNAHKDRLNI